MSNREACPQSSVTAPVTALGILFGVLLVGCSGSQPAEPAAPAPESTPAAPPPAAMGEGNSNAEPAAAATQDKAKAITEQSWGTVDGKEVKLYTLKNKNGLVAKITNYGGIVTELHVPDKSGKMADVVLGYDNLGDYQKPHPYFGAMIGRVANRIKNAQFTLEGKPYKLAANMDKNHLHGGKVGWDKVVWTAEPKETDNGPALRLTYVSKDGEEGYPGTVTAHATYTLTNANELRVDMDATTDKTTIINMAHHSYWNLGGHNSGTILEHEATVMADQYTPGDATLTPDGKLKAVKGTPFDFNTPKAFGKDLKDTQQKPLGYDNNYVIKGDPNTLRLNVRIKDPKSGRVLELWADQPGLQFYSGNFLDGSNKGKGGAVYAQHTGMCLESQKFPNAINVPAWKDQVILKPGQTYKHTMVHKFMAE